MTVSPERVRSPHPLLLTLPGLYRDDRVTQAICEAFDEVLAPAIAVLDSFPAYLDLDLAPEDTLAWLSTWVGVDLDPGLLPDRQRELLRAASVLQGWQGTARGVALAVEALVGFPVEVVETGAADWSRDPNAPLPGKPGSTVVVTVRPGDADDLDVERLTAVVEAVKPAHVVHHVEIVESP